MILPPQNISVLHHLQYIIEYLPKLKRLRDRDHAHLRDYLSMRSTTTEDSESCSSAIPIFAGYDNSRSCHNLLLSGVDVTVIYLHTSGNDYERQPSNNTGRDIMRLAMDLVHVHGVRTIIIGELARFPVHQSNYCILENSCLRRVAAELPGHHIRLCHQRRCL